MDQLDQQNAKSADWDKKTLEKLLFATLTEQRRKRRWRIFFLLLSFGYAFFMTWTVMSNDSSELYPADPVNKHHTAKIDIVGPIMHEQGVAAEQVIEALQDAFKAKNCSAVVLHINSPGGSGVQANQIYKEVKRLRATRPDLPVYAVIDDIGASAAYWIASSADQIYADQVSLVGSIGVLINGFGFVKAMDKLGVDRRLYTSGKNKGMLDPFSPAKPEEEEFIKKQLDSIHQQFIDSVKAGRMNKLAQDPDLFSGQFWMGSQAKQLGLIDGFGDLNYVAREIVKAPKIVDYTIGSSMIDKLAKRVGANMPFGFNANTFAGLFGVKAQTLEQAQTQVLLQSQLP